MLVEVKIQCDCGTKYKFDVEPLKGRMPQRVFCPGCGFEGTDAANEQLREKLSAVSTTAESIAAPAVEVLPPGPLPFQSLADASRVAGSSAYSPRLIGRGRFLAGVTGAILAGAVGGLGWFFLIKVTGYQIGFAAWCVGLLVGMGARGLGRVGGPGLAVAAGMCALAAVAGGQLLALHLRANTPHQAILSGNLGWLTLLWLAIAAASAARIASTRAASIR